MKLTLLKVLLVEDNPADALLVKFALDEIAGVQSQLSHVTSAAKAIALLQNQIFDVIFLDLGLPDSQGLDTFLSLHAVALDVPTIALTGVNDEQLAFDAMRAGAADYLVKDFTNARSLERSMRYAIERKKNEMQRIELVREQTARLQAEAHRSEAEAANRAKDEFLATLSHELRTPLNAILGWATLLRNRQLDEVTTQQALETIERNALTQAQLIEDLLDVSRIITGNLKLKRAPVELAEVVSAATQSLSLPIQQKKIDLKFSIQTPAIVDGDATRLQQIVWNLLANAVKFSTSGGRVEVPIDREPHSVTLTVRDEGHGIDPAFVPHVFDRFRQADSTPTRAHGGLGLGLAIVRNLVQLHGGKVGVHSDGLGHGATFTITLPAMQAVTDSDFSNELLSAAKPTVANHAAQCAIPNENATLLRGVKVLGVDDHADARELMLMTLSNCGAEVCVVDGYQAALEMLESWQPDVLVSDVGMPDIDGYQLMSNIRALPPECGGQVPAIALTGYAGDEERDRALAAGFQLFLPKPLNPFDLVNLVHQLAQPVK